MLTWRDMMRKNVLKRVMVGALSVMMLLSFTACNKKLKVSYDCNNPGDYVKLGEYKGVKVTVDVDAIANNLIEKRVKNDLDSKTTYSAVSRQAKEEDQVTVDFTGTIGGEIVSGFCSEDYSLILGKDTFVINGFIDALYGMSKGETKIVTLTVPENFSDEPEYAGRKIVYEITMKLVEQPNVPMITDAYVQENFSHNTVSEYKQAIKDEIQSTIDEQVESAKKEAVLKQLQQNCEIKGYPEEMMNKKTDEYSSSISFYAMMQGMSNEEYCQKKYNISFDDYVKKAVAQDLIFQLIAEKENLDITEYEYKGDLESFAKELGYSNKTDFVNKFGKDKIVKNMLFRHVQQIVMDAAIYN
jgi:trigger factor